METLVIFIAIALLNAAATWMKAQKKRQQKQQAAGHGKTTIEGKAVQKSRQASAPAPQKPHREQTDLPDLVKNILEQIGMDNPPPVPEAVQEEDLSLDDKKKQAKVRQQRMQAGNKVEKKQPALSAGKARTVLERKVEEQNLPGLNDRSSDPAFFEEGVSDFEAMSEDQLRERELIYTDRKAEAVVEPVRTSKKQRRRSPEARDKLRQGLTWAVILGSPRAHRKSPLHQGPGKIQ